MNSDLPRWATNVVLPFLNLLTALVVAAGVIYLLGESPLEALAILVNSSLGNVEGFAYTLFYATTFILTGLSVSVAMQAGLFNIGSDGQMYLGGLGLTLVMLQFDASMPSWFLISLAFMGAALFGAAWAFIPGYLQARRGSHVVVTTIMFNFIAASLMNFLIITYMIPTGEQNPASRVFAETGWLPRLGSVFPVLGDTPLNLSFVLAVLFLLIYGVVVWRTRWGYALRAAGKSAHAAQYAGISMAMVVIVTMLVSGALAGVAAMNTLAGSMHYLSLNFTNGAGFIGIAVALMGRQHPIGIFLSAVLFGILIQGGFDLSLEKPNIPAETFVFIQGLIILFCGAMENMYAPALSRILNSIDQKWGKHV
ncbi:ABC transporter permease [Undibacterium fentianense]|uniref:ABC transporter permease n=1 Tax=Undibacterium fentianense TaxID=2828728 RepID=A0A941DZS8_9BURK|nr:ABC transporter permease [Undibacterium fentianense]MBR7799825.1 ABC transporter permease [Undibacterium fentianense]